MTVGVVGLGLIGGSLALRLLERGHTVLAWNHTPHPYASAAAAGVTCVDSLVDLAARHPDVIVLCNPLKAMPSVLSQLADSGALTAQTTLTDVGSVKGMVREQVVAAGLGSQYVGAHPMAGNEKSGWDAADPRLFDDALWALTVDADTDYRRFLTVASLVTDAVGNRAIVLDDTVHDKAAALISHMPHVVATALANELTESPDRNIAVALAAGSWRDMTRVALTDPDRTRAMVEEDAENVEALLRSMARRLTTVADHLRDGRLPDAQSEAASAGRRALLDFFSAADPFRAYKALDGVDAARYPVSDITVHPRSWRRDLLESARRGEHIIRVVGPRTFSVITRSAL